MDEIHTNIHHFEPTIEIDFVLYVRAFFFFNSLQQTIELDTLSLLGIGQHSPLQYTKVYQARNRPRLSYQALFSIRLVIVPVFPKRASGPYDSILLVF